MSANAAPWPAPAARHHAHRVAPAAALRAGATIGLSVSLLFAFLLFEPALITFLRVQVGWSLDSEALGGIAIPLALLSTLGGGAIFARQVESARGQTHSWRRPALLGGLLAIASLGGFAVAALLEPLGLAQPDAGRLLVFRAAFTVASMLVAFLTTLGAARVLIAKNAFRHALAVSAVVGLTYLAITLLVDPLPGWHVGGGDRAMLRVASLANFLAGLAGGTYAFTLLAASQAVSRPHDGPSRP